MNLLYYFRNTTKLDLIFEKTLLYFKCSIFTFEKNRKYNEMGRKKWFK